MVPSRDPLRNEGPRGPPRNADGPSRRDAGAAHGSGMRQPVQGEPQAGPAARHREPQGVRTRRALEGGTPNPLVQRLGADDRRPDLCRGRTDRAGTTARGRAGSRGRVYRAQGRPRRHRADDVRPAPRPARRHRLPGGVSRGVRRADADGPRDPLPERSGRRGPAHRRPARQRPNRDPPRRGPPGELREPCLPVPAAGAGRPSGPRRPRRDLVRRCVGPPRLGASGRMGRRSPCPSGRV